MANPACYHQKGGSRSKGRGARVPEGRRGNGTGSGFIPRVYLLPTALRPFYV